MVCSCSQKVMDCIYPFNFGAEIRPGAGSFILDNNNLVIPSAQPHFETSAFQYWNTARVLERICVSGTNFRAL